MSIFQLEEWWATNVGASEEFHNNSICVGNIDNSNPPQDKIVVGSFEGILRIFSPQPRQFRTEDVLIEKDLQAPILQVDCAQNLLSSKITQKYLDGADPARTVAIAVLHSRKLSIALIVHQSAFSQYQEVYTFNLQRNAYNFLIGDFGPNKTSVVIVQSVDGALFVMHQETQLFQVQLSNFLIPGPITCFNHPYNTILIANSNLEVESYRYTALQTTSKNNIDEQKEAQTVNENAQRIEPDWTCNLGEQPMLMVAHHNKYSDTKEVIVSCEQTIFILTDKGQIRYQRRLDYTPSCLLTYHLDNFGADIFEDDERTRDHVNAQILNGVSLTTPCFMSILGSFNNFLLVYKDIRLVWAAKTQLAPIFVARACFESRKGLIVTLADNGFLQVSYLGTEQLSTNAHANSLKGQSSIDYQFVTQEHTRVLQQIKSHESERQLEPTDQITLSCQLSSAVEACNDYVEDSGSSLARNAFGQLLRQRVQISISYNAGQNPTSLNFANVRLSMDHCQHSVHSEESSWTFETMNFEGRATPQVVTAHLYPKTSCEPSRDTVQLSLTYQQLRAEQVDRIGGQGGKLRSATTSFKIPFAFFVQVLPDVIKDNDNFKMVLNLDKPCPSLLQVFSDVQQAVNMETQLTNTKQLTFVLRNQETVSVLVSKDDLKLRLQANTTNAISFVLAETHYRLKQPQYGIDLSSTLKMPALDLMEAIDKHFAYRNEIRTLRKTLEDRTYQLRIIQKKLLNRFKDKNPSALNNLDFLLQHTYQQVIELASQIEALKNDQKVVGVTLSNAITSNNLVLSTLCGMSAEQYELLSQLISSEVDDECGEVGWEELTLASTAHLLRTCLSKKGGNPGQTNQTAIEPIESTEKLKRQLAAVYDRVKNGGILAL